MNTEAKILKTLDQGYQSKRDLIEAVKLAERERCTKIAEESILPFEADSDTSSTYNSIRRKFGILIAERIRSGE